MDKISDRVPNLIIIGDVSYDTNKFFYESGESKIIENLGGSSVYASIPASLFYKVGLVSNAGEDFDINKLKKFNIDLKGLHQRKNEKTIRFYNVLRTRDRQERETKAEYNENLATKFEDIPQEFLNAKFFYIATMPPRAQKNIIKKLKNSNPQVIIGVDTIEQYADMLETKEVFDMVDIAFIDKEFTNLLNCDANTKVIKLGKTGCILKDKNKDIRIKANVIEDVVDKTGAGDCLNGVFMNLIANDYPKKTALSRAVEIATLSIKDFGILSIKERIGKEINSFDNDIVK